MNKKIIPNSFVAVSDFHSMEYPLEKIKKYYLNEYDKIFILGDATDRGEYKDGTNGLNILEEIKYLSELYPDRVIYVPGNHDSFLYDYGKYGDRFALAALRRNWATATIKDVDDLRVHSPSELNDLMEWLGRLPLQRTHEFSGEEYVFAHAFFDQTLYNENPYYSLEDLYRSKNDMNKHSKLFNIIWFRKDDDYFSYDYRDVPSDVTMVIGHTPKHTRLGVDLSLNNSNGEKTKVVCVDGGVAYNYNMLKYDGGSSVKSTPRTQHTDTSPKRKVKSIFVTQKDWNVLQEAIIETTSRHGLTQVQLILEKALNNVSDWYIYFSRKNRTEASNLGILKIQEMLKPYRMSDRTDTKSTVQNFLYRFYVTNKRFRDTVDKTIALGNSYDIFQISDDSPMEKISENDQKKREAVPVHTNPNPTLENSVSQVTRNDTLLKKQNSVNEDYQIVLKNGQLIILGTIPENKIESVIKNLIDDYGIDMVSNSDVFDYEAIMSQISIGETGSLGDSGYLAHVDESGNIQIFDEHGLVFSFENSNNSYAIMNNGTLSI